MGNVVSLFGFVFAGVVALALAFPLSKQLKKHPWVFYLLAIAAVAAFIALRSSDIRNPVVRWLSPMFQKGYLASWLLFIVMFTGVLDEGTPLRRRLQPVRGELSILSFIFILGHLAVYVPSYLPRLGFIFSNQVALALSFTVAAVLAVLFAVLAITSFGAVRSSMSAKGWKRLQRFSYVMMALLLAHVVLAVGRSALYGGSSAIVSLVGYTLLVGVYAVLRIRKAKRDASSQKGRAA